MDDTKHTISFDNFVIEISEFKGEKTVDIFRYDKDGNHYEGLFFKRGESPAAIKFLKQIAVLLGITLEVEKSK